MLRYWCRCLAPCGCLPVCVLIDNFAHQAQYTPDDIANDDLARLC